jgi:ABC-2 type transport system permease protein
MPRKTSFCKAALLRSDAKRYWPLLFLYTAVWVMILPLQLLKVSRWETGAVLVRAALHNTIHDTLYASIIMGLLFGCLTAMAVWSYLMTPRTIGLMHALPVNRTQQFFSHAISGFGMLTAGNVLVFLLSVGSCAARGYVDWAMLGAWLLLTELMGLFFFALASLCAMATGWLLAIPVLYGAANAIAILLHTVVQAMAEVFYYGYTATEPAAGVVWLTPVGKLWLSVNAGGEQWIDQYGAVQDGYFAAMDGYRWETLNASAYTTCFIYAAAALVLLALVWWLYQKRSSEMAGDAMAFRWLRPVARWTIGLCGGWGLGLFLHYVVLSGASSNLAQLLVSQIIMGVVCFFGAQMLLQKRFRIFNKRWWIETAAMLAVLAAVTVGVKADITGYQHRIPAAEDVTSVRVMCSAIDMDTEDPALTETVIALHRAILEQYDREGAPGSFYPTPTSSEDTSGEETVQHRYVRMTYTLKNGTKLAREYLVRMQRGTETYTLLTELANTRGSLLAIVGLDYLERWGGVDAITGGYVLRYEDGAELTLSGQQAKTLAESLYADIDSGALTVDILDTDKVFGTGGSRYGVTLYLYVDGVSRDFGLDMPLSCTRMWEYVEGLELNDGTEAVMDTEVVS